MDKSPIMAQDSSDSPVVLGSRTTSVYLLDPLTGALISGVHNLGSDSAAAEVPKLIGALRRRDHGTVNLANCKLRCPHKAGL